jgi:hypothetical protein
MKTFVRWTHALVLFTSSLYVYAGNSVGTSLITDDGTQYQIADLSQEASEIAQTLKDDIESGKADNFIFSMCTGGERSQTNLFET